MMSPHEILARHLHEQRLTAAGLAARLGIGVAAVEAVLAGEACREPPALHRLGQGLGADAVAWSQALAAINIGVGAGELSRCVHGRLWALAIAEGASLAQLAERYQVRERVLQLVLASGRVSRTFLASPLPAALGYREGELPGAAMTQVVDARLGEMLATAMASQGLAVDRLATDLGGIHASTLKMLISGRVPRKLQYAIVPALARRLHIETKTLARQIALTWRTLTTNAGTIKYEVVSVLFAQGQRPEWLARRSGVTLDSIRNIFEGRLPARSCLEKIRSVLQVPPDAWEEAVASQDAKRVAGSLTYRSLAKEVRPLRTLILEACDAQRLDPRSWAARCGISSDSLHLMVERHRVPRRAEVRHALMRCLSLDRATFAAACRKTLELRDNDHACLRQEPRTALQEMLQRILRQGVHLSELARRINVNRGTLLRIIRSGGHQMMMNVRERLRQYLRIDPDSFLALLEPLDRDEPLDDDVEMRLIADFRRLGEGEQRHLLELASRLRAGVQPGPGLGA